VTILVCGPERSGTTPLAGYLTAAGLDVEHRSYPEGGWWPPPGQYAHVVAVTRWMPDVIAAQVRRRFQPDARAARSHIGLARRLITEQYGAHPGYLEVTYEALHDERARHDLAVLLGATDAQASEAVGSYEWRPAGVLAEVVTR
jgi:hypothetical protein